MTILEDFFREVDRRWRPPDADKIVLRIIGSTALMLQANYERGTKDSDVLETAQLTADVKKRLLDIAGKGTSLHTKYKLYLDIVLGGLPFLPQVPRWHPLIDLNESLGHFEIVVLDVVDVVVSKLKRFKASDRSDIEAMAGRDLVPHHALVSRFRAAVDNFSMDARADDLPTYVQNLNQVERDILQVAETSIDLPDWV